jgi:hypothetical protein
MLIVVNPGIVFTSLTNTSPDCPSSRKSTRARPAPSTARKASIACWRTSSIAAGASGAGINSFDPASMYLAS